MSTSQWLEGDHRSGIALATCHRLLYVHL